MTAPHPDDEDDLFAGEYALGLLEGPDLAAAQARIAADRAFADRVEAWAARLSPMLEGSPAEPSDNVWQAISARLAANDEGMPARPAAAVRGWRWATLAASAVAASLALVLVTRPAPEASAPATPVVAAAPASALVASLQDDVAASAVTISVEQSGGQLIVTPVRLAVEGRTPELWIIPGDGTPRSLGVIPAAAPSRVAVPEQHRAHLQQGATFAISLEPAGGSPTGAPTGPVAASGKIVRI